MTYYEKYFNKVYIGKIITENWKTLLRFALLNSEFIWFLWNRIKCAYCEIFSRLMIWLYFFQQHHITRNVNETRLNSLLGWKFFQSFNRSKFPSYFVIKYDYHNYKFLGSNFYKFLTMDITRITRTNIG